MHLFMKPNPSPENVARIAREAIQRVATQRLPLTPENYAQAYAQASGSPSAAPASEPAAAQEPLDWAALIARLMAAVDTHHSGITLAKKREGLQRALAARAPTPHTLHQRLEKLIHSWALGPVAGEADKPTALLPDTLATAPAPSGVPAPGNRAPVHAPEADARLAAMSELFTLLLENVAELTPENGVLQGQIRRIKELFAEPVSERSLTEAKRQVRAMIVKQGIIKHSLDEAKAVLKQMLSTLVDRLSAISDSTGDYHKKIETYVEEINATEDFTKLSHVVKGLLSDTRVMSADILRAREELVEARQRVREQEHKIQELEIELVRVSELVRTDPLTEALNRRGFEEVYTVEMARAERTATPLCLALIDLDDFKRLNDAKGHQAGDEALVHLVSVIKDITRPTDAIGRYGGEEFVILYPDTAIADAVLVTARIQRSLTKRFFLHNNERLFISFSAGVAAIDRHLGLGDALERADRAVYEAKSTGKNKVVKAQGPSMAAS